MTPATISTQLLPTLRSTTVRFSLSRDDASTECDVEAELLRGGMPRRDRHTFELKRICAGHIDAAVTGTAALESRGLHELAIGFRQVVAAAVRIGERFNGHSELPLEYRPRSEDLPARNLRRDLAEID